VEFGDLLVLISFIADIVGYNFSTRRQTGKLIKVKGLLLYSVQAGDQKEILANFIDWLK